MSLGDILETEIQGEIQRIHQEAQDKAAQIVQDAQTRAQSMVESRQRALNSDYAAGLTRARSAADLDTNAQKLAASDTLQVQAFQAAEQQLQSHTASPDYAQTLQKLIQEGLHALPDAQVIEASVEQHDAIRHALHNLGRQLDLRVNDSVKTGVRLLGKDGKTSVQNTLLGRLNSGRSELSAQVSRLLADS